MRPKSILFATLLVLGLFCAVHGQQLQTAVVVNGGVITLYAHDPLGQSMCLRDGQYGAIFQDGQVRNRCSNLNFDAYNKNSFTAGIQGGEDGVIIDLGDRRDLQAKYGYSETVGGVQGFASIGIRDRKAYILKDYPTRAYQPIAGTEALFTAPDKSPDTAVVKVGHIYLLRIADTQEKTDRYAKLIVLSHVPDESVTFRWLMLDDEKTVKN